ncbi:MAG TPA: glycerol-3-phosphate 1-O-acyltransferase PlsY [Alphaproteobacteria bacterium]
MIILFAILGYLIGSIPFGLILTRAAGLGDIRAIGSGNIGATNVLRTGNKKLAAATLILDGAKGAAAVFLAHALGDMLGMMGHDPSLQGKAALCAGLASIIGHIFPVWLKFKGGKGVATTLGILLALAPWTGLAACVTWLAMAFAFRISSLSALTALALTPLSSWLIYHDPRLSFICALIAALIFYTHRANIGRLMKGEEPKIGKKKEKAI